MILIGNQRGGAGDLARHLMKQENERVEIHEIRGFVAGDLEGAFIESEAISKGTKCRQHLYSLPLNPPKTVDVTPAMLVDAVERAEKSLGLTDQPRAIVFHTKHGRMHTHAVCAGLMLKTCGRCKCPMTVRNCKMWRGIYTGTTAGQCRAVSCGMKSVTRAITRWPNGNKPNVRAVTGEVERHDPRLLDDLG